MTASLLSVSLVANSDNTNPNEEKVVVTPPPPPSCIGSSGTVIRHIFKNPTSKYDDFIHYEPHYPQSPDYIEYTSTLQSTYNYENYYASVIRGFIRAPETGQYVFNITGDDYCEFYISTDTFPSNISDTTAWVPGYSWIDDHTKYPEQTSDTLNLVQDEYYYFEVFQQEGGGGDHVQVYWKMPSTLNQTEWELVHGIHIYEYLCGPSCPPAGTACDDGDPTTIQDQQDGACNCWGTPATIPFACIGDRGGLTALYWDGINGDNVVDLENHASYPLSPTRAEAITRLQGPSETESIYGTRLRGYLYIPVTGNYNFAITGNNETEFYLSTAQTPSEGDMIANLVYDTEKFDFYEEASQISGPQALNAGTFYSIELLHKEHYGDDHFRVFWKTPFASDTSWHIIDGSFLYQYACEIACVPAGLPCDDGDSQTFNDQYDGNCNCVGTPCDDEACSNQLGFTPYDDCGYSENHTTDAQESWLSCQPSVSPNPARGLSHWIHYNFGALYKLDNAKIWNYNVDGATSQGFNTIVIDYSVDGVNWTELGTFNLEQADGSINYDGELLNAFSGIVAQHVLITGIDNFDASPCMGISEITWSAYDCPSVGSACDDGDVMTVNDIYDANCNCAGTQVSNACLAQDTTISLDPHPTSTFEITATIMSASRIYTNAAVQFIAGETVTLMPGFHSQRGSSFLAAIIPCNSPRPEDDDTTTKFEDLAEQPEVVNMNKASLRIAPNPTRTWTSFDYVVPESGKVRLGIFTSSGQLVTWILNGNQTEKGRYSKQFPGHQLPGGVYFVTLQTNGEVVTERLVIVD